MDNDHNLLFGARALEQQLIDAQQLADACLLWQHRRSDSLAELLVELGWIGADDRQHLEAQIDAEGFTPPAATQIFAGAPPDDTGATIDHTASDTKSSTRITADDAIQLIDESLLPGDARYAVGKMYAEGGIGRIWLARDGQLDREVAIKTLRPEYRGHPRVRSRFLQEARITGQLEHPGIVPVYELGIQAQFDQVFYAMRFVRGRTLVQASREFHQRRKQREADGLEFVALLSAFVAVCNTVAYAHSRGVIHRDLKGENVLLGDFGEVLLLDWGVAKVLGQPDEAALDSGLHGTVEMAADRTVQGDVIGTPAYMAPEQAEGRLDRIDQRTDLYGLGAIFYEILTGQPPFAGTNTIDVLSKVLRDEPIPPRDLWPEVPPSLESICLRCLSKDPFSRPDSASELAQQVQAWQETQRRQAEDSLRRQGEILQSILDNMGESLLVANEEGRLMLTNPAAERLLGTRAGETLADLLNRCTMFLADGQTPCTRDDLPLSRALLGESVDDAELLVVLAGQHEGRWLSANARTLRDADRAPRGAVMVLRDVTERKRAAEELRRSRERFELAVQGSQDGLWDWDLETDEVYYSPRWKSILGYEDHEIAHHIDEWDIRLHPDEREQVLAANFAHISGTTSHYEYEYRLRHKDGTFRWILARGVALRDAHGKAYRMAGSHVDITAWKQMEETLLNCQSTYRAALTAAPCGMLVVDALGVVQQANLQAAELLGLTAEQLSGRPLAETFPELANPETRPAAPEHRAPEPSAPAPPPAGHTRPFVANGQHLTAAWHPIESADGTAVLGHVVTLAGTP